MLPHVYTPQSSIQYKLGIIPHYVDLDMYKNNAEFENKKDVLVIDVTQPIEAVIDQICRCEVTVSSSLHGIIVSHAYGRHSVWMKTANKILGRGLKFYDYFGSVGIGEDYKKLDAIPDMHSFTEVDDFIACAHDLPRPDWERVRENGKRIWEVCPLRLDGNSAHAE